MTMMLITVIIPIIVNIKVILHRGVVILDSSIIQVIVDPITILVDQLHAGVPLLNHLPSLPPFFNTILYHIHTRVPLFDFLAHLRLLLHRLGVKLLRLFLLHGLGVKVYNFFLPLVLLPGALLALLPTRGAILGGRLP
ncbi:hypothetical protein QBC39DRAFT_356423 [Podospora conica]|nr:hypothetical protein QBC39DRAFT_356423 [Schizothecium conicum]